MESYWNPALPTLNVAIKKYDRENNRLSKELNALEGSYGKQNSICDQYKGDFRALKNRLGKERDKKNTLNTPEAGSEKEKLNPARQAYLTRRLQKLKGNVKSEEQTLLSLKQKLQKKSGEQVVLKKQQRLITDLKVRQQGRLQRKIEESELDNLVSSLSTKNKVLSDRERSVVESIESVEPSIFEDSAVVVLIEKELKDKPFAAETENLELEASGLQVSEKKTELNTGNNSCNNNSAASVSGNDITKGYSGAEFQGVDLVRRISELQSALAKGERSVFVRYQSAQSGRCLISVASEQGQLKVTIDTSAAGFSTGEKQRIISSLKGDGYRIKSFTVRGGGDERV